MLTKREELMICFVSMGDLCAERAPVLCGSRRNGEEKRLFVIVEAQKILEEGCEAFT